MKENTSTNLILVLLATLLIVATSLSQSIPSTQETLSNQQHDMKSPNDQKSNQVYLLFQRPKIIEIFADVQKKLLISKQQLIHPQTIQSQQSLNNAFSIQCKSIVRMSQIYVNVYFNDNKKAKQFNLKQQSNSKDFSFSLKFLSDFEMDQIKYLQLTLKSSKFSVIRIALLNYLVSSKINLEQEQKLQSSLKVFPLQIPGSYNSELNSHKQLIKYFQFQAHQNPIKITITRIKGHPKIFLYNCQSDKIDFCKEQIYEQHVEGSFLLQKQIEIQIENQNKCKNCSIILAFKNMGVQTEIQIMFSHHKKFVLPKGQSLMIQGGKNQYIQFTSYFQYLQKNAVSGLYIDISVNDGDQKGLNLQYQKIVKVQDESSSSAQNSVSSKLFVTQRSQQLLRSTLNEKQMSVFSSQSRKDKNNQSWYRINLKIHLKDKAIFSIVDQNGNIDRGQYLSLKDGQIFHTKIFRDQSNPQYPQLNFKVNFKTISTLAISLDCSNFNNLQITQFNQEKTIAKLNPKIFIKNITNHHKKCSQLIHLNPNHIANSQTQPSNKSSQLYDVFFKFTGVADQISLLYSSVDIILLEKSYSYHSQIQYHQGSYFYIKNISNAAIIKIQKCSDCHISLSYSQEQLADLKSKRSSQIITKQVNGISDSFIFTPKTNLVLFIKIKTNNFAYFVIKVQEITQHESSDKNQIQKGSNYPLKSKASTDLDKIISYSLQQNNTLVIQFEIPKFAQSQSLNSITYFSLIQGSINPQVTRQTYCPEFIFNQRQRTRDITISDIIPQVIQDSQGKQKMTYSMQLKHHDYFGIRAQKGSEIFSYHIVNIERMKEYSEHRWAAFHVLLFLTFALFMSFVCFMALKKKKIKKIGGQIVEQRQDGQQTSMIRLK